MLQPRPAAERPEPSRRSLPAPGRRPCRGRGGARRLPTCLAAPTAPILALGALAPGVPAALHCRRECEGNSRAPTLQGFVIGALPGAAVGAVVGALVRTRSWRVRRLGQLRGAGRRAGTRAAGGV